jgi:protein-disulfide isomerase
VPVASKKDKREQARREREDRARAEEAKARRDRRLRILGLTLGAAVIVVIAAILISSSGGRKQGVQPSSPAGALQGSAATSQSIGGIPQNNLTLGNAKAPVTIHEYADLQCPVCDDFSLNVLPQVIQNYVRTGKVKVVYENFPILGNDSVTAAYAAAAAGMQNKAWDFLDLWYRNQGPENSGYVTPAFIRKIAAGVPGLNVNKLMQDRTGSAAKSVVKASASSGAGLGFNATPSFLLQSASGKQQVINGSEPTYGQLAGVINSLLQTG